MHVVMIQMIRGSIFGAYSIMLLTMKNQLSSTAYAVYYIRSISIGNKRRANWIYFSASIAACWRILDVLELPHQQIVLQLPQITPSQRWVLTHVAENYRRNGFRIGVNAANLEQASDLLGRVRPDTLKIDVSAANNSAAQIVLLEQADRGQCQVIFRKIETERQLAQLQTANNTVHPYAVQGFFFDTPRASLAAETDTSEPLSKQIELDSVCV